MFFDYMCVSLVQCVLCVRPQSILFVCFKAFKGTEYDVPVEQVIAETKQLGIAPKKTEEAVEIEEPKFKKNVLKKGDKTNFPKRGDKVSCYYIGKLENGTVFDSLQPGMLCCSVRLLR